MKKNLLIAKKWQNIYWSFAFIFLELIKFYISANT